MRLLELVVHRVGDELHRVQPDQVGQPQRPHRMRQPGDDGRVDVLDGGDAGLDHPDGRQQVRHQQRVDDEAGPVTAAHHLLAQHVARELLDPRRGLSEVTSVLISSTSGSTGTGLKKCRPEHPARILRRRSDFHDRDARGVRRQHRVGVGDELVEFGEDLGLDGLVLDDRLDDELAVGQVGEARGERQLRQRGVAIAPAVSLPLLAATLQRRGDAVAARGRSAPRSARRPATSAPAFARHLRDARAHLSGADDANSFNVSLRNSSST